MLRSMPTQITPLDYYVCMYVCMYVHMYIQMHSYLPTPLRLYYMYMPLYCMSIYQYCMCMSDTAHTQIRSYVCFTTVDITIEQYKHCTYTKLCCLYIFCTCTQPSPSPSPSPSLTMLYGIWKCPLLSSSSCSGWPVVVGE